MNQKMNLLVEEQSLILMRLHTDHIILIVLALDQNRTATQAHAIAFDKLIKVVLEDEAISPLEVYFQMNPLRRNLKQLFLPAV